MEDKFKKQEQAKTILHFDSDAQKDLIQLTHAVIFLKPHIRINQTCDQLISLLNKRQSYSKTNKHYPNNHKQQIGLPELDTVLKLNSIEGYQTLQEKAQFQKKLTIVFSQFTFFTMTRLLLKGVGINNCQFLYFLDAPVLRQLNLGQIYLTTLKSLTKSNLPSLNWIVANIKEIQPQSTLQRCKFPQLKQIYYHKPWYQQSPLICFNLSFLAKIQTFQEKQVKLCVNKDTYNSQINQFGRKDINRFNNFGVIYYHGSDDGQSDDS